MKKEMTTAKALLIILALLVIVGAISWAITTGIIYLICLCFSWKFSLLTATGVWLIECLLYWVFCSNKEKK